LKICSFILCQFFPERRRRQWVEFLTRRLPRSRDCNSSNLQVDLLSYRTKYYILFITKKEEKVTFFRQIEKSQSYRSKRQEAQARKNNVREKIH
jgi:hypothetical protein